MTSYLDKLNLRPGERRLVVIVALVVIGFLYFFFVWPEFAEWNKLQRRKLDIETDRRRFQREIDKTTAYQTELRKLKEKGTAVDSEAQALDMQRAVTTMAAMNSVFVSSYAPGKGPASSGGKTNSFFEETTGTIQYSAEETALVNFLYALSSGNSLIRVSSMTLQPELPGRFKLMGSMTLVASYPKKPAQKAAPAATPGTPAAKPVPAAAKSPGATPKSISAAMSAATKPGATNAPASASWWGKVKGWFSSSASGTNAPAKKPAATNAPPK